MYFNEIHKIENFLIFLIVSINHQKHRQIESKIDRKKWAFHVRKTFPQQIFVNHKQRDDSNYLINNCQLGFFQIPEVYFVRIFCFNVTCKLKLNNVLALT